MGAGRGGGAGRFLDFAEALYGEDGLVAGVQELDEEGHPAALILVPAYEAGQAHAGCRGEGGRAQFVEDAADFELAAVVRAGAVAEEERALPCVQCTHDWA